MMRKKRHGEPDRGRASTCFCRDHDKAFNRSTHVWERWS